MITRSRPARATVAAAALFLLGLSPIGGAPGPHPARAAAPITGLFLDTAWGYDGSATGKVHTMIGADVATANALTSQYGSAAGVGARFAFYPTDTAEDGTSWVLDFEAPPGTTLTTGTYNGGTSFYDRAPGVAFFQTSPGSCGITGITTFTVFEASFDGDGVPTSFAASFVERCAVGYPARAGEIRYNSSVGMRAHDITPLGGITFPVTDQGDESASQYITLTNSGTLPLHPAAPIAGTQMVVRDPCPTTLAVGASCTIEIATAPTLPDGHGSIVGVTDDTVAGRHDVLTVVYGRANTTTTLTSSVDPDVTPGGVSTLVATVTPQPPIGTQVKFFKDGSLYATKSVGSLGRATVSYSGWSGTHTLTAQFQGHTYYKPSTSSGISQSSSEKPTLKLAVSPIQAPPGQAVSIDTSIALYPSSPSAEGGTVTVVDELTGTTLATYGMADATPGKLLCLNRLGVGTHRIRATYDGFGDILPATTFVDVTVAEGAEIVDGTQAGGGIRCSMFLTPDEAAPPAPGQLLWVHVPVITTIISAVAGTALTNVRVSNAFQRNQAGELLNSMLIPYGQTFEFSLIDPAYGGTDADGTRTLYWQFQQGNGVWSDVSQGFFGLDRGLPSGTVTAAAGATYATSTGITLSVPASDATAGLAQVAISNDGTTWTTRSYASSQAWTLPSSNGTKTVRVKWKDKAGNWSAVKTDTIMLDTVAPTLSGLAYVFASGSALSSTSTPTRFTWTGADATSGIARYEVGLSTDGGAYTSLTTTLTSASLTRSLASGHTYRLRVRAVDKAGLTGAYVATPTFTVAAYQENSSRLTYSGTWARVAGAANWGGYEEYATGANARASFTFTGRAFGWVGCVGANRGSARIYVNGVLTKTVSLYATATVCKQLVATLAWTSSASRKIEIVVVGTSGHPRVGIDALVTGT